MPIFEAGPAFRIDQEGFSGGPNDSFLSITALTDGGFAVAWISDRDGPSGDIRVFARKFDADGNPVGNQVYIETERTDDIGGDHRQTTIAALPGGGFSVRYIEISGTRNTNGGIDNGRFWSREATFDAGGALISESHPYGAPNASVFDGITDVGIASDGAGGIHEVRSYYDGTTERVVVNGVTVQTGARSFNVQVEDFGDGAVACWTVTNDIYGAILRDGFAPTPFLISDSAAGGQEIGDDNIATLSTGGFVVTWRDGSTGTARARVFDAAGQKVGTEISLLDSSYAVPAVSALGNGDWLMTYAQDNRTLVQVFDDAGNAVGAPFENSFGTVGEAAALSVTQLANGNLVFAGAGSGSARAQILTQVNDVPVANPDLLYVSRGSAADFAASVFLANDTDEVGGPLSLTSVGGATNGAVSLAGGQVTFTATAATAPATGGFIYQASDGALAATGTVGVRLVTTTAGNNAVTVNTLAGEASWIEGRGGNDKITGGAGMDRFFGDTGNDYLFGLDGADVLYGGEGSDRLDGGAGIDRMFGGAANDTYYVDTTLDEVNESTGSGPDPAADAGGIDLVYATASFTLGAFVENLTLRGDGAIDGTGNGLANKITGNGAANHLIGAGGADTLTGGVGADVLEGGEDGDTYYADTADTIFDSGAIGTDTVITNGSSVVLAVGNGIENLAAASGGTANTNLTGNEQANRITGNDGANYLKGMDGNDVLNGGIGDDRLEGGAGKDTLTGGVGADRFIFKGNDSPASTSPIVYDSITDFLSGTDKIDLDIVGQAGLAVSQFSSTTITSNSYAAAFSAAQGQFADALHKAVFVAGTTDGWLFWTNDADATTADAAVRLAGAGSSNGSVSPAAVQRADIV